MNSEFQRLPPETQEAVKRTMDTMEPAQTPAEIRETLEGTQKGGEDVYRTDVGGSHDGLSQWEV